MCLFWALVIASCSQGDIWGTIRRWFDYRPQWRIRLLLYLLLRAYVRVCVYDTKIKKSIPKYAKMLKNSKKICLIQKNSVFLHFELENAYGYRYP